jgi:hypothetical protein
MVNMFSQKQRTGRELCVNVFVVPFFKLSIFQKQTGGRKQKVRQSSPDQTRQQHRPDKATEQTTPAKETPTQPRTNQYVTAQSRSQCLDQTITVKFTLKYLTAKKGTMQRPGGNEDARKSCSEPRSSAQYHTEHDCREQLRQKHCRPEATRTGYISKG